MSLESYRNKRDFSRSPEPSGDSDRHENAWRFVVQKHDATRLHYDLRLELDGVLLSWAIPKGPSLDWAEKRLAIHVEDHPIDYLEFEGVIPAQEYGGGTVMVWDLGTWQPRTEDPAADYQAGELKFDLAGHKLQGGFMLKRLEQRREEKQWLLIKEKDSAMREIVDFDVLAELPDSVLTQRSMEEIAADRTTVWSANAQRDPIEFDPSEFAKAKPATMPEVIRPSLPTASRQPPSGKQWVHEIKHDGYRMICHFDQGHVRFQSRNGKDWTSRLPSLSRLMMQLPCEQAILDGEIVMLDDRGRSSFQSLQNRIGAGKDAELHYVAFDLLHLNGYQLTQCPFDERKQLLQTLVDAVGSVRLTYCEHVSGDGTLIFQQACKLGAEGIVSKRIDKRYAEGRFQFWQKTKCLQSREFVIGGFTLPTSSRQGLGAVLLGAPTSDGTLRFLGKVGTGFSHESLLQIRKRLDGLLVPKSPFENLNRRTADKGTQWVAPEVIAEIEFGGWTDDELIRFGSFKGIREEMTIEDIEVYDGQPAWEPALPPTIELPPPEDVVVHPALPIPEELAQIKITSPERVVYPDMGITKLGLATYFAQVGTAMLPHIVGRPMSLLRCPGGLAQTCFFQKRAPFGLSDHVERIQLPTSEGEKIFLVVRDLVGLLSLIQFGAMELHVSNASADDYDHPDQLIFDLDPDAGLPWQNVQQAARDVRERLEQHGLRPRLKTSGGTGLHLVADFQGTWQEARDFSRHHAENLAKQFPKRFTVSAAKAARRGRIYLDVHRNVRGASTIAAYSTRAKRIASVSTPLHWEELDGLTASDSWGLQATMDRLAQQGDPWVVGD